MGKHTPGPWEVSNDHTPQPWVIRQAGRFGALFEVKQIGFLKKESALECQHANARLIAAAPELLAACEDLMDYILDMLETDEPYPRCIEFAREVITRATEKEGE
jgi:hypothetical protein